MTNTRLNAPCIVLSNIIGFTLLRNNGEYECVFLLIIVIRNVKANLLCYHKRITRNY